MTDSSRKVAEAIDNNSEHKTVALGSLTKIARNIDSSANTTDVVYALKSIGWVLKGAAWICRA